MNLSFLGISAHQNIRNISDNIPRNDAEIHQSTKALQNYKMQTLFNQSGYTRFPIIITLSHSHCRSSHPPTHTHTHTHTDTHTDTDIHTHTRARARYVRTPFLTALAGVYNSSSGCPPMSPRPQKWIPGHTGVHWGEIDINRVVSQPSKNTKFGRGTILSELCGHWRW